MEMAWSEVQTELAVARRVRLQQQNTEDESRATTQTCTVKSYERSLRSGRAGVAKFYTYGVVTCMLPFTVKQIAIQDSS